MIEQYEGDHPLQAYVIETSLLSLLCCALTIVAVLYRSHSDASVAAQYEGWPGSEDASDPTSLSISPVFKVSNLTLVPPGKLRNAYRSDGAEYGLIRQVITSVFFFMGSSGSIYFESIAMFRPPTFVAHAVVLTYTLIVSALGMSYFVAFRVADQDSGERTAAGESAYGRLILVNLIFQPGIYCVAYMFHKNKTKRNAIALYLRCLLNLICRGVVALFYIYVVFDVFLYSDTAMSKKLILRSVVHTFFTTVTTSASAFFADTLQANHGVDHHDSSVVFCYYAAMLPMFGRILQTSSRSLYESITFEIAATLAELMLMDGLLRGVTPVQELRNLLRKAKNTRDAAIAPEPEGGGDSGVGRSITRSEGRNLKEIFCADAVIILSVSEGASLVVATAIASLSRSNMSGEPGGGQVDAVMLWANFAVMVIGEFVVTDGLVGHFARTMVNRYKIDPANEWGRMKKSESGPAFIRSILFCVSVVLLASVYLAGGEGCMTAQLGEEAKWALTSCPQVPEDILEFSRVGRDFEEEWLAAIEGEGD
jgi:hypothetical protein